MMKLLLLCICIALSTILVKADVSHLYGPDGQLLPGAHDPHDHHGLHEHPTTTTTPAPPPHPYAFSYTAGRYPGHVDRQHSEQSDGSGVVRGSYSYIDPRHQVRTVNYVADQNGFHPSLSHDPSAVGPPRETEAVQQARDRHLQLYAHIAEQHANHINPAEATIPVDTEAVALAKHRHFTLFEAIAADHARIGAERAAERAAFEATSVANDLQQPYNEYVQTPIEGQHQLEQGPRQIYRKQY